MDLKAFIEEIALENLANDKHFLVDVIISSKKGPKKILVLLDGDEGITVDDCAKLSRAVANIIEEQEIVDEAFTLDVSSPGLDHPLKLKRQYVKNVGREVKVLLDDGSEFSGELLSVGEEEIVVNNKIKKGKKIDLKEEKVPFNKIIKTNVLVSFK